MKKVIFILILCGFTSVFGQKAVSLETILSEAQKQTDHYRETFKNLLAAETKTFAEFNQKGEAKKTTSVKSSFLVYQSGKNSNSTAEMRVVLEIDGKLIPDSQKRGEQFLAELDKEKTYEKELKKLQSESLKYDKTWLIDGLTLNEAPILAPNLRPFFDFKLLGSDDFNGGKVFVVSYLQNKPSPFITVNSKAPKTDQANLNYEIDFPDALKKNQISLRGKLWIDAKTFQIRREERELVDKPTQKIVLLSTIFEYQPSDYSILVPKTIQLTFNKVKGKEVFEVTKRETVKFEYTDFRQTNVEVRILDDEEETK